ncbi:MAG: hypothetical protein ACI9R3_000050 [Verrucomicrobiales bacterium]
MSPSPIAEQDKQGVERYSAAWQAIMELVRKGSSWSGYERNCCFLNTGGEFASAAFVGGLNFPDDGRGIAVTDWDQDGDLDLWMRNRTAPRLRLLLNTGENASRAVSLRLRGKSANRDAIGAVVKMHLDGEHAAPLVRSVRAGDLFLSQSSKWLHFGVPANVSITKVDVLWPGGERSSHSGIEPGNRYHLTQGSAKATPVSADRNIALKSAPLPTAATVSGVASVVLPAPVALPMVSYFAADGRQVDMKISPEPMLLLLWSASCPHCKAELTKLANSPPAVDVLALCVDGNSAAARDEAAALLTVTGYSGEWGLIDAAALERLQAVQEALFDKAPDFAVPLSLLLSQGNEIVAVYRGGIPAEGLAYDLQHVVSASSDQLRNLAPPFSGRWFTLPPSPDFVPNMIATRIQAHYPEDAISYLRLAATKADPARKRLLLAELGRKHYSLARKFVEKRQASPAEYHFTQSLNASPNAAKVHNDFGTLLAQLGRLKDAEGHFAKAVQLQPDYPLAQKNLKKARELQGQSPR